MREKLNDLTGQNAQLIAVDPHEIWSAKYLLKESGFRSSDLSFPLLMDPAITASADYGVAFQMRIHTEVSNRPATFLIDRNGIVRYAKRGRKFADRPSTVNIIDELKKLND